MLGFSPRFHVVVVLLRRIMFDDINVCTMIVRGSLEDTEITIRPRLGHRDRV